jgi:hypothetical protein
MKLISKLTLAALATSMIATTVASADDQQLQNRLALQQAQNSPRLLQTNGQTSVAVYAGQRDVGRRDAIRNNASQTHFEWRHNGSGGYGAFVQGQ